MLSGLYVFYLGFLGGLLLFVNFLFFVLLFLRGVVGVLLCLTLLFLGGIFCSGVIVFGVVSGTYLCSMVFPEACVIFVKHITKANVILDIRITAGWLRTPRVSEINNNIYLIFIFI